MTIVGPLEAQALMKSLKIYNVLKKRGQATFLTPSTDALAS
jgi:hypothetical protein